MPLSTAIAYAVGTLTASDTPANTNTVTIGGKVYTYQTTLTNVDGNVAIGADLATSLANLAAAINLGAGSGTAYAAAMTENEHVKAVAGATTLVVTAKVPGSVGNFIATTETHANASWGAATLASGSGSVYLAIREIVATQQVNAGVLDDLDRINGSSFSIG